MVTTHQLRGIVLRRRGRVAQAKCLEINGVPHPLRFCFLQRVGNSSLSSCPLRTVQPAILAIQPSISTIPCIILNQSLNPCYPSLWLAGSTLHLCVLAAVTLTSNLGHLTSVFSFSSALFGHNGALPSPLPSITSALFPVQRRMGVGPAGLSSRNT